MKHIAISLALVTALALFGACGDSADQGKPSASSKSTVTASLDDVVAPGVKMEKIDVDYNFDTAGLPLWVDGDLYFTNNIFDPRENSKTMKLAADGTLTVVRPDNGVTTASYNTSRGTIYCCEMVGHRVVEMDRDGKVLRTVAGELNGVRLDGPNDLTIDNKGGIYFTDSHFSPGEDLKQDGPMVLYIKPDGGPVRVVDGIEFPNGLELSPDGKILYIVNTKGADKGQAIYAFDVQSDGSVNNRRVFAKLELTDENKAKADGVSGADGTAVDVMGNLYVATTQGLGIQVFNAAGSHLGNIPCPSVCNNLSFGGKDMKTMYISAKDGVYQIPVKIAGKNPPM